MSERKRKSNRAGGCLLILILAGVLIWYLERGPGPQRPAGPAASAPAAASAGGLAIKAVRRAMTPGQRMDWPPSRWRWGPLAGGVAVVGADVLVYWVGPDGQVYPVNGIARNFTPGLPQPPAEEEVSVVSVRTAASRPSGVGG